MSQTKPAQNLYPESDHREVLVKVEHVSKKFCRSLKKSLWYGAKDITSEFMGRKYERTLRPDEFWAVNDISFELRRGECLGLIGHNGAGKTTLLKMLNGLIKPDKGRIEMNGRVGALISLGTGFNPILTGRENIYVNASILGLSKKEIDAKIDDIIEFAEIGDFIDTPVQNYSSGMQVRLGFSVAVNMNPDILLIDEVLAVGDVGFKHKAYAAIYEVMRKAAVIFVSHSISQVGKVCNRGIVLKKGRALFQGPVIEDVIDSYFSEFDIQNEGRISGTGQASLIKIEGGENKLDQQFDFSTDTSQQKEPLIVSHGKPLKLSFLIEVSTSVKAFNVSIGFTDKEMKSVATAYSANQGYVFTNSSDGIHRVDLKIPALLLNKGIYKMLFRVQEHPVDIKKGKTLLLYEDVLLVQVLSSGTLSGGAPVQFVGLWEIQETESCQS